MDTPKLPLGGSSAGSSQKVSTDAGEHPQIHPTSSLPHRAENIAEKPSNGASGEVQRASFTAIALGACASLGGFMFGYESGQISGFIQMADFKSRFAEDGNFSNARTGTIVSLLCIGTLFGCLISAPVADKIGRRFTISGSAFSYIIGVIIEITSDNAWYQFAIGRLVAGLGIGALSVCVPMYQSESVPKSIRGVIVSSYQLMITLGIWTAYMINWGTENSYINSAQWRIPNGLSALWAIILGASILLFPESPRFAYRMGRQEEARVTMARLGGTEPYGEVVSHEINEIEQALVKERAAGKASVFDLFTGPRMLYRTLLGIVLQAGQQLTGANYFFYYATTIFSAAGLQNPYVTSIILGSVNVAATILCLAFVDRVGRRKALMVGAGWMFMCFMVYAFVGHFMLQSAPTGSSTASTAGTLLIVFTCLFIAAFATTWGPLVWTVVGELYPAQYRASGMAIATASNWGFNFLISFFSPYITAKIDYFYGLVFGGCCAALLVIVYFFLMESKDRSLEEIDTMYVLGVDPRKSAGWNASEHAVTSGSA